MLIERYFSATVEGSKTIHIFRSGSNVEVNIYLTQATLSKIIEQWIPKHLMPFLKQSHQYLDWLQVDDMTH